MRQAARMLRLGQMLQTYRRVSIKTCYNAKSEFLINSKFRAKHLCVDSFGSKLAVAYVKENFAILRKVLI